MSYLCYYNYIIIKIFYMAKSIKKFYVPTVISYPFSISLKEPHLTFLSNLQTIHPEINNRVDLMRYIIEKVHKIEILDEI